MSCGPQPTVSRLLELGTISFWQGVVKTWYLACWGFHLITHLRQKTGPLLQRNSEMCRIDKLSINFYFWENHGKNGLKGKIILNFIGNLYCEKSSAAECLLTGYWWCSQPRQQLLSPPLHPWAEQQPEYINCVRLICIFWPVESKPKVKVDVTIESRGRVHVKGQSTKTSLGKGLIFF